MQTIDIVIDGTPGTSYSANWTIYRNGNTYIYKEPSNRVPQHLSFEGRGITGQITLLTSGRLDVTVIKAGNRSRSSTQGKNSILLLEVR